MNKRGLFGHGTESFGVFIGIILVAALLVGYSFIKTGTLLEGINEFIEYIMQDPIAAGVIFIAGVILGKAIIRIY